MSRIAKGHSGPLFKQALARIAKGDGLGVLSRRAGDQPESTRRSRSYVLRLKVRRGYAMDWNRVEGNWKEAKGKIKEKWGSPYG